MIKAALVFLVTNVVAIRLPMPVDLSMLAALLPLSLYGLSQPRIRLVSVSALAISLLAMEVYHQRALRLGADETNLDAVVRGRIAGLPQVSEEVVRFVLAVDEGPFKNRRLQFYLYRPDGISIRAGERWQFSARLSPARGAVNFGLFDYEQWLFVKRLHGRGYVRMSPPPRKLEDAVIGIDSIRETVRLKLMLAVPGHELATFSALTLGDTGRLSLSDWKVLNGTGTTHLLIVSGLHVGLIATMTFWIMRLMGVSISATALITIVIAGVYAALSGWGLPVQRALVMCGVVLGARTLHRQLPAFAQFVIALIAIIVLDPLATLASGFWLSFGAVFFLVYALSGRLPGRKGSVRAREGVFSAQWTVFVGLLPVLAIMTGKFSAVSLIVNMFAIPFVGLLLVPSSMIGLIVMFVYEGAGTLILSLVSALVRALWWLLGEVSGLELQFDLPEVSASQLVVALVGCLILLAPHGLMPRWPAIFTLLFLSTPVNRLNKGNLRVTFLDVGQGLSVVLETSAGIVLYDTGPSIGNRFSAAEQTVLPTLRGRGWASIQTLVLSHGDNDHSGGAEHIYRTMPVLQTIRYGDCQNNWQLGGVHFFTFSPSPPGVSGNDGSCILLVQVQDQQILLTGDIESGAESRLARLGLPHIAVMSSPHHGSLTSSSPALLNSTRPDRVVVSAGYRNRFSHPSPVIMKRYENRSISVTNTAITGAVQIEVKEAFITLDTARKRSDPVWRFGSGSFNNP